MKSKNYDEFVEKFKPKLTTDDCYTPGHMYDAIADWVARTYGVDRASFCRPFFPGGDYESECYDGKIVVDNPPFSILSKIITFYQTHGVRFFLFAPALTMGGTAAETGACYIPCGASITYENGAKVRTSFVTNLEDFIIHAHPDLTALIKATDDEANKKNLPVYAYPDTVVTGILLSRLSEFYEIKIKKGHFVRHLDAQKEHKKTIYGGGLLISDEDAKQMREARQVTARMQAEQAIRREEEKEAKTIVWQLSEREQKIVDELNR